jgi:hypothetical protein
MFKVNFPRHFAYLFIAAVLLVLTHGAPSPHWVDRDTFLFGEVGLLHATALALALSKPLVVARRIFFVAITAALSAGVPITGAYVVSHLHFYGGLGFFALYAVSSALGAAAYWVLIRLFWFRALPTRSLFQTVGMCVGATFASLLMFGLVTQQGRHEFEAAWDLPTIFWWFGFSLSLWIFGRNTLTANNRFERSRG